MNCCISFPWSCWIYIDMFCNFSKAFMKWENDSCSPVISWHLSFLSHPMILWPLPGHFQLYCDIVVPFFGILINNLCSASKGYYQSYILILNTEFYCGRQVTLMGDFFFFFSRWYPVSPNNIKAISHGFCVFISHKYQLIELSSNQK